MSVGSVQCFRQRGPKATFTPRSLYSASKAGNISVYTAISFGKTFIDVIISSERPNCGSALTMSETIFGSCSAFSSTVSFTRSSSVSEISNRSATEVRRILCGSNEENRCLGIFGMNPDTTEKTLMKLFSRYGHVKDIKLIYDGKTNVSRGYSFIYFKHASDARRAQRKLNGTMLEGRKVRVDFSRSKPHEPRADRRKRVSPTVASTSADRCCHRRHGATHHKKRKKRRVCYSSSDSE
uniref:RRM domain-containing protein n=1 Tax=Anopheles coluzzii TaxID=1518534 RepID=A0A8W7PNK7_ANOCL